MPSGSGGKSVHYSGPVQTGNVPPLRRGKSGLGPKRDDEIGGTAMKTSRQSAGKSITETPNSDDIEWVEWAQGQLTQIAGQEGKITLEKFRAALNIKQSFFSERFFVLSDKPKLGKIATGLLITSLETLTKGDGIIKLSMLFDAYDTGGKGTLDKDRFRTYLSNFTPSNSLKLSDEHLDTLTDTLFDEAKKEKDGGISFDEFYKQLKKYPSVVKNLRISVKDWLTGSRNVKSRELEEPKNSIAQWLINNIRTVIFVVIYWLFNGALMGCAIYKNWKENFCIIIARACGMCLNFNSVFALVPALRYCLTWLRNTRVGRFFPIHERIGFHKMVAVFVVILAIVHSMAHVGNVVLIKYCALTNLTVSCNANLSSLAYWEILFTTKANVGYLGYGLVYVTGTVLVGVLFFICIFSLPTIRGNSHFEVFCCGHLLYIAFLGVLIVHSAHFWKFLVGPGTIFLIEKLVACTICRKANHGKYYIIAVDLLPSKVTHLKIARPPSFTYKPGDYCFINIPAIATNEWHPFALSSAPELKDEFWIHIQAVGPWTSRLYDFFKEHEESSAETKSGENKDERIRVLEAVENGMHSNQHNNNANQAEKFATAKRRSTHIKIFIDGPYRTSVSSYNKIISAEHAVLITSGAGAIPFVSILQSLIYQIQGSHSRCPGCAMEWYDVEKQKNGLKQVDFVWINTDQRKFEWLFNLFMTWESQLQKMKGAIRDFLQIQAFMTAASDKKDLKGVGLQMALDSLHNRNAGNPSKIRVEAGRPNFDEVFTKIACAGRGQVHVFFCGLPVLAKCIKRQSRKHGFRFSRVRF